MLINEKFEKAYNLIYDIVSEVYVQKEAEKITLVNLYAICDMNTDPELTWKAEDYKMVYDFYLKLIMNNAKMKKKYEDYKNQIIIKPVLERSIHETVPVAKIKKSKMKQISAEEQRAIENKIIEEGCYNVDNTTSLANFEPGSMQVSFSSTDSILKNIAAIDEMVKNHKAFEFNSHEVFDGKEYTRDISSKIY